MNTVQTLKEKALQGVSITKEEALSLADQPLDELCQAANELREHFCDKIKIGGLRAENVAMRLAADETLDSILASKRGWFEENSRMAVV